MGLRDILVFLTTDDQANFHLSTAARLAAKDGAVLTGLCACPDPIPSTSDSFVIGGAGVGDVIGRRNARIAEAVAPTEIAFRAATQAQGVEAVWTLSEPGAPPEDLARAARLCDLAVLPRPRQHDANGRRLAELVVLGGGAPSLLVPPGAPAEAEYAHVVLAWDGSREAARALADGLRFMRWARRVTVVIAGGEASSGPVTNRLARHGVASETRCVAVGEGGVGAALLRAVTDLEANLLVMGAYGRSRAAEMLLGGATRAVLSGIECPVLMSH